MRPYYSAHAYHFFAGTIAVLPLIATKLSENLGPILPFSLQLFFRHETQFHDKP